MKKYENPSNFPETVDDLIFFQDIDIPHRAVYDEFRRLHAQFRFSEALEYMNNEDGVDGYFADLYNLMAKRIYNTQFHLKCMDNRFICMAGNPLNTFPYVHKNMVWFNYDPSTKRVNTDADEHAINEVIREKIQLRYINSKSTENNTTTYNAIVPTLKTCIEDVYLDKNFSFIEDYKAHILSNEMWNTGRTYKFDEEIVEVFVADNRPKRDITTANGLKLVTKSGDTLTTKVFTDDFTVDYKEYLHVKVDGEKAELVTKAGERIRLIPDEPTPSIIYVYGLDGTLLKKINESKKKPVLDSDPVNFPEAMSGVIHAKCRLLANIPTQLWHRLSFATTYSHVMTDKNTNIKQYLDSYMNYVSTNMTRLLSCRTKWGIPSATNISSLIAGYLEQKDNIVSTIEDITSLETSFDSTTTPMAIAIYIYHTMYVPIINAAYRLARRKGGTPPASYTMVDAIESLKQYVPTKKIGVIGADGQVYRLVTKSGDYIILKEEL